MTNLDKLKSMSVKEIVNLIVGTIKQHPIHCPPEHDGCIDNCTMCWTHWFNAECKDTNSVKSRKRSAGVKENLTADDDEVNEDGVVFVAMSAEEFKMLKERK